MYASQPPAEAEELDARPATDPARPWYHSDPVLDATAPDRPPQVRIDYFA